MLDFWGVPCFASQDAMFLLTPVGILGGTSHDSELNSWASTVGSKGQMCFGAFS